MQTSLSTNHNRNGDEDIAALFVKLYLDEDITAGPRLAQILRHRGYDVITTNEAGNSGLENGAQLAYAASHGRALLTFNTRDYVALYRANLIAGEDHAGIIVSAEQLQADRFSELMRLTLNLLNRVTRDEIRNQLRYLQEFK